VIRKHNYSAISQDHIRKYGAYLIKKMSCSNQSGFVLIGLIITMIIIAVLGAALVHFTTTSTFSELFTNRQQRAYYVAESGGRYAIPQIKSDLVQATTDLHGKTFTLNNGDKFVLSIDNTDPEFTHLESEGIVHEGDWLEVREKITYEIPKSCVFDYGTFASGRVLLNDDAYIDSYDSSVSPWSSEGAIRNGHVGTNRIGPNSIRLRRQTTIYGDAVVGPGGNPSTDINVAPSAQITGTTSSLAAARDMTPRTMPAGGGVPYDLLLQGNEITTFTEGTYRLNRIELTDDASISISGDVTLYVEDTILIEIRGVINIQPGGSLKIYAAKELLVIDRGTLNPTEDPENLIIFGTTSFNRIQFMSNSLMRGAIFASNANTTIQGNAEIFGSVISNRVTIQDDAMLHYDEALGAAGYIGGPTIQYF
jgi:type II secretory pathway pseudopilin PulG